MKLSRRLSSLKPSSTVAVMNKAKALTAQGVKVLNFSAGEPDFNSPEKAKRALIASVEANNTKYLPTAGDPETRKLLAELAKPQLHPRLHARQRAHHLRRQDGPLPRRPGPVRCRRPR